MQQEFTMHLSFLSQAEILSDRMVKPKTKSALKRIWISTTQRYFVCAQICKTH